MEIFLSNMFYFIVPFLLILSVVVAIHELGHFWVGRLCGVKVDAFSLGFGPEILGYTDRGGVRWRLALFPMGGYVKFYGDANGASVPDASGTAKMSSQDRSQTLQGQPVWKRAAIVAAGPIANILLAVLIFSGLFYAKGTFVVAPKVGEVVAGSVAEQAGFKAGDAIVAINGHKIASFDQVVRDIIASPNQEMTFNIDRAGEAVTLQVKPIEELDDSLGVAMKVGRIGVRPSMAENDIVHNSYTVMGSLDQGVQEVGFWTVNTFASIGQVISGKTNADQLAGPAKLMVISGNLAKKSTISLLDLAAILSLSLGLLNLLPIPLLDGGHLMFYAFEAIRRRPLSEKTMEWGFRFGLATIAIAIGFVYSNDLISMLRH